MTYAERTLDYLWTIAPDGAMNADIARRLGATSHQTIYMLMQDLLRRGLVRGEHRGRTWVFYAVEERVERITPQLQPAPDALPVHGPLTPATFEALARHVVSERYAVALARGSVPGVRKQFDFVSSDRQVVGDAIYSTRLRESVLPSAKFAAIAERVWLLEKTAAPTTFLVFGNDREVPIMWLARYGNLVRDVAFFFLADDGQLELLAPMSAVPRDADREDALGALTDLSQERGLPDLLAETSEAIQDERTIIEVLTSRPRPSKFWLYARRMNCRRTPATCCRAARKGRFLPRRQWNSNDICCSSIWFVWPTPIDNEPRVGDELRFGHSPSGCYCSCCRAPAAYRNWDVSVARRASSFSRERSHDSTPAS